MKLRQTSVVLGLLIDVMKILFRSISLQRDHLEFVADDYRLNLGAVFDPL
jgi:hypothetical protein